MKILNNLLERLEYESMQLALEMHAKPSLPRNNVFEILESFTKIIIPNYINLIDISKQEELLH